MSLSFVNIHQRTCQRINNRHLCLCKHSFHKHQSRCQLCLCPSFQFVPSKPKKLSCFCRHEVERHDFMTKKCSELGCSCKRLLLKWVCPKCGKGFKQHHIQYNSLVQVQVKQKGEKERQIVERQQQIQSEMEREMEDVSEQSEQIEQEGVDLLALARRPHQLGRIKDY